jgi:hypothetical protein
MDARTESVMGELKMETATLKIWLGRTIRLATMK